MGEVCVHNYYKIPSTKFQAVDVGGPATVLSIPRKCESMNTRTPNRVFLPEASKPVRVVWSSRVMGKREWTYDPITPVYSSKLFGYFLRSIGTGVIDDNDLPIEIAV